MEALRPTSLTFGTSWPPIRSFLQKIFALGSGNQKMTKEEWVQGFTDIYSLCVSTQENMYEKLYKSMDRFLADYVQNAFKALQDVPESRLLEEYHTQWTHFKQGLCLVDKLFGHLNRQYIKDPVARDRIRVACDPSLLQLHNTRENTTWLSISELAILHWRELLLLHLTEKLADLAISIINRDRDSPGTVQSIDRRTAKTVGFSFVCPCFSDSFDADSESTSVNEEDLEFYREYFEKPILDATQAYYKKVAQAASLDDTQSIVAYMKKVSELIKEERNRSDEYIPACSHDVIIEVCRESLLSEHVTRINNCILELLATDNQKALSLFYNLMSPLSAVTQLLNKFSEYVTMVAKEKSKPTMPTKFVTNFISVHKKFYNLIGYCFMYDKTFYQAFDEAMFQVINRRVHNQSDSCTFMLSLYIDHIVRQPGISEVDIKNLITMFGYLSDKDLFYSFCLKALALRLLSMGSSVILSSEEKVVTELKQCCSLDFIIKMQKMLADYTLSSRISTEFEQKSTAKEQFSIQVFQTGSWPLTHNRENQCPVTTGFMNQAKLEFKEFYNTKYNGRKLLWLDSLSTVELVLKFTNKPYVFLMMMSQYQILKCFERCDSLSMEELKAQTKLDDDLKKALTPMVACQLLLTNDSKEVSLNLNFTSQKMKHHLNGYAFILRAEEERQGNQASSSLDMDRDHFLQALIVRILKGKKTINHSTLVNEVINGARTRFLPSVHLIKRSIEALVERQFIQRSEKSPDEYIYLA